jgi:ABC-2 type transport system permease protein
VNTPSTTASQSFDANPVAPGAMSPTRPIYWSIRREFWENRYLYIAPLSVASVFLFGYLINAIHSPGNLRGLLALGTMAGSEHISSPFDIAAALMMGSSIFMSLYYCSEALHGERRDRSILFWKSLPVSDFTTVLVKASIPLFILPVLVSAITLLMQFLMLLLSTVVLVATGGSIASLWAHLPIVQMSLLMLYHVLTAHAIWPAPVYCWLLLVSGWAKRATLLWAALPILAIGGLEKLAFGTTYFASLVGGRLIGSTATISNSPDIFPTSPMTHITPIHFLTTPGMWLGLAVAAIFLAAAIRLRRSREPI